ncbi:hypothetical protein YPC_3872 [Yersinia pestis biovar Medievalis str. Harbin 35]|nr:hypothetical protein YPC_3872 [Yersinia pestis biovar Medievalis str. Harbin 35]EEO78350.1 hypothetical protein YP516_0587 [Yersinia pestis Nepal516]EEO82178.1 hypothetical protein YPF_1199 [Yersinia pestis biovar Orientalis str. India 195]
MNNKKILLLIMMFITIISLYCPRRTLRAMS